jgi:dGTPase
VDEVSERSARWAATMAGFAASDVVLAHHDSQPVVSALTRNGRAVPTTREERQERLDELLAADAARSVGAGNRIRPEAPDEFRTCFERDRDRILHSSAFRRLAGKTQVFIFPEDHVRTRLTHALEVAQVATGIARALGLNEALTEAIALGHDCGHGPGGHASEEALDTFVPGGFDHAPWGARVSLATLNLCEETLDGIANHSWSRPAPSTLEGEVVSWADRIAYVCHDFEDAQSVGLVEASELPGLVREVVGSRRGGQLGAFLTAVVRTARERGVIGMDERHAEALAAFRTFNYEHIYLTSAARDQAEAVIEMLRALVTYYAGEPELIPDHATDVDPLLEAVAYVAGMTDRFACRRAIDQLGWTADRLPSALNY